MSQKINHKEAKKIGSVVRMYLRAHELQPVALGALLEAPQGPPNQKKLYYEAKKVEKTSCGKPSKRKAKRAKILAEMQYLTQVAKDVATRMETLVDELSSTDASVSKKLLL